MNELQNILTEIEVRGELTDGQKRLYSVQISDALRELLRNYKGHFSVSKSASCCWTTMNILYRLKSLLLQLYRKLLGKDVNNFKSTEVYVLVSDLINIANRVFVYTSVASVSTVHTGLDGNFRSSLIALEMFITRFDRYLNPEGM